MAGISLCVLFTDSNPVFPKIQLHLHPRRFKAGDVFLSDLLMSATTHRYFAIHKPYRMVSQFVSPDKVRLLGHLHFDFPEGTHAVGRLDNHSEGLLLLTTNKKVTRLLFQGAVPHKRVYTVLVKGIVEAEALHRLRTGITLPDKGRADYTTLPCDVEIVEAPAGFPPLDPSHTWKVPETWLRITLTEGKFHQVRKMVTTVGHRCKRLIRTAIEDLELGDMPSGAVRELDEVTFFRLLHIDNWQ